MDNQSNNNQNNPQPVKMTAKELSELFKNPNEIDPELKKQGVRMTAREFNELLAQNGKGDNPALQIMTKMGQMVAGIQFDPKQFDGKGFEEYQLPVSFFSQKLIESDDLFEKQKEFLFSINKSSGSSCIFMIIAMIFGICFLLLGLYLVYQAVNGINGQKLSGAIPVVVIGGIWTLLTLSGVISAIKHTVNAYWFKLTNHGFECYFGKQFDSQKAKKFSLDDPPTIFFKNITTQNNSQSSRYAQREPEMDVVIKDQSKEHVIEQAGEQLANYIKDFLEYHMKRIKN